MTTKLSPQARYERRQAVKRKAEAAARAAIFVEVSQKCPGLGFSLQATDAGTMVQLSTLNPADALAFVRIANAHDLDADSLNDLLILELLDRGRKRQLIPADATILEKRRVANA